MKRQDITDADPATRKPSWLSRAAWFIGLWLAGVATVSAVSYGIRLWIM